MRLDSAYPWLIQDYITAIKDLTVVYCRGQMFAYSLERTFIKNSADWREFISEDQLWTRHDLSFAVSNNIARYMHHLNLDFGRLDFLLDANDNIVFCEVNPNGQYAWLDINGKDGLLDCIVSEISPETSLHPIPHSCPITSFSEMQLLSTP